MSYTPGYTPASQTIAPQQPHATMVNFAPMVMPAAPYSTTATATTSLYDPIDVASNRVNSWLPNVVFLLIHIATFATCAALFIVLLGIRPLGFIIVSFVASGLMAGTGLGAILARSTSLATFVHAIVTAICAVLAAFFVGFLDVFLLFASLFQGVPNAGELMVFFLSATSLLGIINMFSWATWNAVRAYSFTVLANANQLPTTVVMTQYPPQSYMPTTSMQ
jgi:hypothetical protein